MSVQATAWVWENSESAGNARLVLLAIADAADADGDNAWPTQERMARMVKVSVRTVRRLVTELVMLGELEVEEHAGGLKNHRDDRRPHLYRLRKMTPPKDSDKRLTGGHGATNGRTRRDERADTGVPITPFAFNTQSSNPSGGLTADAAPRSLEVSPIQEQRQEDAVAPPAGSLALFDVPPKPATAESPSARLVVAAFVSSYRANHSAMEPPKRSVGRVAREAKALLSAGEAAPAELESAARQMGEGQWDNLTMALKIWRERGSRRSQLRGPSPALPPSHPTWVKVAADEDARVYQRLLHDDELVHWIAGDPSEVDKWVTRHPELAARFEAVA